MNMKNNNKKIGFKAAIFIILTIFLLVFCQYILLVPFNLHSPMFAIELSLFLLGLFFCFSGGKVNGKNVIFKTKDLYGPIAVLLLFLIACLIGTPYTGGLHNYKNQSKITEVEFTSIPEFDRTQVQLVDKNTAQQLGDRVFGTLGSDEVSQYQIGDDWVQISMNGNLYRVTPIDFGSLFNYFVTRTTPGYVLVDCNSGEAKLVRYEGLKYMKSAYFSHDLYRRFFFADPCAQYGSAKFELDDEGKPYWIAPVFRTTWVNKTRDVKGIMILDPVSGECTYYDKGSAPEWVDNVYPVEVIYTQFAQSKRYENGLFNFSKKGIVEFTDDYAYLLFDDDVHIYTGVTSVGKDESNVGFAYVDLRNGEISYIRKAGAEEYSARSSAEGALQQYHYSAIFPSMVNVAGRPTYFMGLVDSANLIKSYAFVSYENYQNVATGASVEEAYKNYLNLYEKGTETSDEERKEIVFTVSNTEHIVKDGNTLILLLSDEGQIYFYDVSLGDLRASFIKEGDQIKAIVGDSGRIYECSQIIS